MADEPVSTTVTETTSVDTGVDKATVESLNQQFEDFWAGEDAKEEGAPAAPGEGAGQETKETKPDKTDKTDKEPARPRTGRSRKNTPTRTSISSSSIVQIPSLSTRSGSFGKPTGRR